MGLAVVLCAAFLFQQKYGDTRSPVSASNAQAPRQEEKSYARERIEAMTLEEKVGQMFLACVSNDSFSREDAVNYGLGGYLFFADFFENRTPQAVKSTLTACQKAAKIPMLMAVDEEGGTVVRVSKYPAYRGAPFASPQEIYKQSGFKGLRQDAAEKSKLLLSLGLNVNLAPVCDIAADRSSFIYPRTLGKNAKKTSRYVRETVSVMNRLGIGSALKHFPGYGGNGDTHTAAAKDSRSYETFVSRDFLPFQAGIEAGASCVMVSHNTILCMDSKNPASLSASVHEILRQVLGFDGVIMTDDLAMKGARIGSGGENIAVAAIQAGNDLLCTSEYAKQIPAVLRAVRDGRISEQQITDSALRVLEWKESLNLLEEKE